MPLSVIFCLSVVGKTTLLDVLAFRKTAGVVEGTITLNGIKATPANIAQVTA